MKYELKTNRGIGFTFESETFNPTEYIDGLNNRDLLTVALGDMVTHKNNIQSIALVQVEGVEEKGIKLNIVTNQAETINAYVETYNATDVSSQLNDTAKQFILIGSVIIHKHNANLIMPAAPAEQ